jgi:hypothetical protein
MAAAPKDAPKTAEHATQAISGLDLEPELEDLLSDNLADDQSISHERPELAVSVKAKKIHKASILRLYSHPHTQPGPSSTDCLKRV